MNRTTALIYTRVSKLDARDRGRALSPATQLQMCKELPALRGLAVEHFEDLDFSGGSTNRPQYQAMLERIAQGDVAVVAAYSLSRISRSVRDFYAFHEEVLKPSGVAFASATESIDTSTPQGRAFMGMTAVWAQMERELTSERLRDNFEQVARSGKLVGLLPYGYKRVDGEVVIDEPKAGVVRAIFARYATGEHSYNAITDWLNAERVATPSAGRGRKNDRSDWVKDSVRDVLEREVYVGRFVHRRGPHQSTRRGRGDGPRIQGTYPAIVDEATWQACVAVRRRNAIQHTMHYDRRRTRYALTGLLRCEACGSTVHGVTTNSAGVRDYYSCRRRMQARACDQPYARRDVLEAEVRDWLAALQLPPGLEEAFAEGVARATSGPPRRARADRRKELTQRLARLEDLYELGHVERDEYLTKRADVEKALRALDVDQAAQARSAPAISRRLTSLVDLWDGMSAGQRRSVLDELLEEIVVGDGRIVSAKPKPEWLDYIEEVTAGASSVDAPPRVGREGIEPPQPEAADLQSAELTTCSTYPGVPLFYATDGAAPFGSALAGGSMAERTARTTSSTSNGFAM